MASADPNNSSNQPGVRAVITGFAVALVLAGQIVFYSVPRDRSYGLPWGLALTVGGILLFVLASARRIPSAVMARLARRPISPSVLWLAAAIGLACLTAAVSVAFENYGQTNYLPLLFLWYSGAGCYLAAMAMSQPIKFERTWLSAHRNELLGVGAVTILAAALRFYALGAIPRIINGDEGLMGQAALVTSQIPLANPFALYQNFGAWYLQAVDLMLRMFGQDAFALRLLPAVGGTLAVPALYLLARRLFGVRPAFFAAALLAASHILLAFSRTAAVGYVQGTALIPLELYFLISGLEDRNALRAAVGGLILGLHFSVYLGAQVAAAYSLAFIAVATVVCRPLVQKAWRAILAFWGGVIVMALPQAVYSWEHPSEFLARLNADGTFQSGWLSQTMSATGQGAIQILAERVAHVFLSFVYYPAIDFYGSPTPPLSLIEATLFLVGLGYSLWRTRDHRFLLINGYFGSVVLAIGIFAVPPTADSYRILMALPAALLLAGLGLEQLLNVATSILPNGRLVQAGLAGFVLLGSFAINQWTYWVDFAGQCRYGSDPQTRFASYLGSYLGRLDRDSQVYLLSDDVFRYGTHGSVDFLSRNFPVQNVPDALATWSPPPNSLLIAPPSRAAELIDWVGQHPNGKLHREYDCANLMLAAYQTP